MGLLDTLRDVALHGIYPRSFNPGAAAVDAGAKWFGVDTERWIAPEYGSYISTNTAIYTVVKLRASLLSQVPIKPYRLKSDGKEEVTKGPVWQLLQKPNQYWTRARLIETLEMSLCLWGAAYLAVERRGNQPAELWWMRPDRVKVFPHRTEYVSHFEYQPSAGQEPIRFERDEVIWLRHVNPVDEYSGLSPLAAARLPADTQHAAMTANRSLFRDGITIGGVVTPGAAPLSHEQSIEIRDALSKRMKGEKNAGRWLVLQFDAKFQPMTLSPKDAEFANLHQMTLQDVARVYGVPFDLLDGKTTYENLSSAQKLLWEHTLISEATLITEEMTRQLLPMFGNVGGVDLLEFDLKEVDCLREDEAEEWKMFEGQINSGAITINEWRAKKGFNDVEWGGVWWGSVRDRPMNPVPVGAANAIAKGYLDTQQNLEKLVAELAVKTEEDTKKATDDLEDDGEVDEELQAPEKVTKSARKRHQRIAYGSDEHRNRWDAFVVITEAHEESVARAWVKMARAQEQSLLTELAKIDRSQRALPDVGELMAEIFSIAKWRKRFREAIRPVLRVIVRDGGERTMQEVGASVSFDLHDPLVERFLERQAQRFAREVNETTYERLKASLTEGLREGEGTDDLAKRVRQVMGDRIASDAATIARTETIPAYTGGQLAAARQSGVVETKEWLTALDDRVRQTHQDAHGQIVRLNDNFEVGGAIGPGPGMMNSAKEDINCRCVLLFGLTPKGDL